MRFVDITWLTLRQSRRGTLGWIAGIAAITLLYTASYKSIGVAKSAAISSYPESLRKALNLQDLTAPVGYLNSTAFGIPLLLLTAIFVITTATRAVAGDEESGALDLLLTYPISRAQLVLARMTAMTAILITLGCVLFVVVLTLRGPTGLTIGAAALAATTLTWVMLACCLGAIALLISAAVGRRSATLAISSGVTLFAYLAGSFIPLISHLSWVRHLSPFEWFLGGDPLLNGLQAGHIALLLATTVVATGLAARALSGRDLHV